MLTIDDNFWHVCPWNIRDLSEKSKPAPWIAFHSSWRFIGKYPKSTCFLESRNFIPKTSTWQVRTQHPAGNHVYNSHEMEIDLNSLDDLLSVQCQCLKQTCGYTFLSHQLVGPPCCHGENTNILPLECAAESWLKLHASWAKFTKMIEFNSWSHFPTNWPNTIMTSHWWCVEPWSMQYDFLSFLAILIHFTGDLREFFIISYDIWWCYLISCPIFVGSSVWLLPSTTAHAAPHRRVTLGSWESAAGRPCHPVIHGKRNGWNMVTIQINHVCNTFTYIF